jgi:hypothetical protein
VTSAERLFVHLAYLDETGTDGHSSVAMFGALIIPAGRFGYVSAMHDTAVQQILPIERIEEFQEFHACQLYRGTDIFEGIDEEKRFTAIQVLLNAVRMEKLHFVYAAADRKAITDTPFATMRPLHAAFHMCLLGVEDWATANHPNRHSNNTKVIDWNDTFLCILDDCNDKNLKAEYKKTYRTLRTKHPFKPQTKNRLWHAHDDMFFADSTDCLGVQMADLCNYFVRMRLDGVDEPQNFYDIISKQIICAKPKPDWDRYGHLFRTHEEEEA